MHKILTKIYFLFLLIIVIYFYYSHYINSVNFPYFDEYRTISKVVIDFLKAKSITLKMKVLFVKENESIQFILKILNIGYFLIFGKIRYDFLAFIGQLSLLVFPYLIFKITSNKKELWFQMGITVIVIFNLQYYVLSFRHDTAFYYFLGIFGTLLSVLFWIKKMHKRSLFFFVFAVLNNASSFIIIFVYLFDFLISENRVNRKLILKITLFFIVVLTMFLIWDPNILIISQPPFEVFRKILLLMGNYGGAYSFASPKPYELLGAIYLIFAIIILTFNFFFYNSVSNERKFYSLGSLYFLLVTVAIGIKRSGLNMQDLLDERYRFFTFTLFVFLILLLNSIIQINKIIKIGLIIFLVINNIYSSLYYKDYIRFLNQGGKINSISLKKGYDVLGPAYINYATMYYKQMDSLNLAPKPNQEISEMYNYLQKIELQKNQFQEIQFTIERKKVIEQGNNLEVCALSGFNSDKNNSYIFLKSNSKTYIFPINYYMRNSLRLFLKGESFTKNHFYAFLYLDLIDKGEYRYGIVSVKENLLQYNIKLDPNTIKID
jgi:hypothetical protein